MSEQEEKTCAWVSAMSVKLSFLCCFLAMFIDEMYRTLARMPRFFVISTRTCQRLVHIFHFNPPDQKENDFLYGSYG